MYGTQPKKYQQGQFRPETYTLGERKGVKSTRKFPLQEPGEKRAKQPQRTRKKNKINIKAEINKNQREKQQMISIK